MRLNLCLLTLMSLSLLVSAGALAQNAEDEDEAAVGPLPAAQMPAEQLPEEDLPEEQVAMIIEAADDPEASPSPAITDPVNGLVRSFQREHGLGALTLLFLSARLWHWRVIGAPVL